MANPSTRTGTKQAGTGVNNPATGTSRGHVVDTGIAALFRGGASNRQGGIMRKLAMLAMVAFDASVAHAAHWERLPNGALVCRGSYPGIGAQGQLIEVCPPDPISREELERQRQEYDDYLIKMGYPPMFRGNK